MGFHIFGTKHLQPQPSSEETLSVSAPVYTTQTPKPRRPKPRSAREALDRIAQRRGWSVEQGTKECGHHWSVYRRGDITIRVDWTFRLHIRYATLRSPGCEADAPTKDTPMDSHHARFAWVADHLYRQGVPQ
ncbi:hypothetical protein SEA_BIPPER_104 [Mycobacterium phage Bipper]|uniref:Uncharacterized protein n=1 Tax=Mycobacterium phage Bipper TaxID=1805457 RepID=A0A142F2N2_9CAUD|nr:hypothetical protein KCH39_gp073 [Mycobacterium phage Bipper]AMQ67039.1 hypothetical protein SEA_BIPPER_104 [Mycobacterium phage Bipper]